VLSLGTRSHRRSAATTVPRNGESVGTGGFAARRPIANRAGAARCHVTRAGALIRRQCREDLGQYREDLGRVVKITSFLAGQAFEPETIRDM
jgi:hypothetical protein